MKYFLLFALTIYVIDTLVYLQGHNTMFWHYKTPNELEAQRKRLGLYECKPAATTAQAGEKQDE